MAKKGGLGAGLGALFGEDVQYSQFGGQHGQEDGNTVQEQPQILPITKVEPKEGQPRQSFDADSLDELTKSIQRHGILQPITVRKLENGFYQIIAGERRWRAARAAGLDEVPVRILEADDRLAMEMTLVENLQREDLNPIEEAQGYRTLMEEYGLTQEEAALAVGKSRPTVANSLRLLSLAPAVLAKVESGELSAGHARALLPIRDAKVQLETAEAVIAKQLSVRQTEALAARLARERPAPEEADSRTVVVDYVREVERELENSLGRKVKLVEKRGKGRIELEFYGAEDREKLIEALRLFGTLRKSK